MKKLFLEVKVKTKKEHIAKHGQPGRTLLTKLSRKSILRKYDDLKAKSRR